MGTTHAAHGMAASMSRGLLHCWWEDQDGSLNTDCGMFGVQGTAVQLYACAYKCRILQWS